MKFIKLDENWDFNCSQKPDKATRELLNQFSQAFNRLEDISIQNLEVNTILMAMLTDMGNNKDVKFSDDTMKIIEKYQDTLRKQVELAQREAARVKQNNEQMAEFFKKIEKDYINKTKKRHTRNNTIRRIFGLKEKDYEKKSKE
jgi:hypothetical protein